MIGCEKCSDPDGVCAECYARVTALEAELLAHDAELRRMEKCARVAKRALTAIFTSGLDPDPPEGDQCAGCLYLRLHGADNQDGGAK
ncbi:unnamed protein product [marine sediment metagenome]|uniref:Uncharacterized protein n=1 Tax=marine sediment metagenome TaxID=412755 RepID=X0WXI1_9ZZZZ